MQQRGAGARLRVAAWVMVPLGLALLLGGIVFYFMTHRGVTVAGASMEPTLRMGQPAVVQDIDAEDIRRGDVLLLQVPGRYQGAPVIQRVIGKGGDHVVSDGERVTVNGEPLTEPYVNPERPPVALKPYDVRVPEGRLFLLGDNRGNANDSRYFLDEQSGSVATAGVRGRVNEGLPPTLVTTTALGAAFILGGAGVGFAAWRRGRRAAQPAVV
ncbi:signal peptidase I [Streptomyces sp. NPDC127049]|uniref:signal peptidase I n=1 Tax=Streptomyces sp. NPDC127049 TaxID=3347118 RepID=UPI003650D096